jgi:hypothetical protein
MDLKRTLRSIGGVAAVKGQEYVFQTGFAAAEAYNFVTGSGLYHSVRRSNYRAAQSRAVHDDIADARKVRKDFWRDRLGETDFEFV